MIKVVLLVLGMVASTSLCAADSVVIGRFVANKPMDYVPDDCPADAICLRSWWLAVVDVGRTVSGPPLKGRTAAAIKQHMAMNDRYKRNLRMFVLRPIESPSERARLRVDYYLLEVSPEETVYCLSKDPKVYGLDPENVYSSDASDGEKTYCFPLASG